MTWVTLANLALTGLLQGMLIGLAALAVSLCFAVARFSNAAVGDLMTLGAYAAVALQAATGSLLLGGALAVVALAALSVATYGLVFRHFRGRSSEDPIQVLKSLFSVHQCEKDEGAAGVSEEKSPEAHTTRRPRR